MREGVLGITKDAFAYIVKQMLHVDLLLQTDLDDMWNSPYNNGTIHFLDREVRRLDPSVAMGEREEESLYNAVFMSLVKTIDGNSLDRFRQTNGGLFLTNVMREYIDDLKSQENLGTSLYFIYHSYASNGDMGSAAYAEPEKVFAAHPASDWTSLYNNIDLMGNFEAFLTEKERDAAMFDEDDGEEYPQIEQYPIDYHEALYYLLRERVACAHDKSKFVHLSFIDTWHYGDDEVADGAVNFILTNEYVGFIAWLEKQGLNFHGD